MNGIIDFHTHAFPDGLAEKAMAALEAGGDIKAHLDGKLSSLVSSMNRWGIEKSIVCSIATRPAQFGPILNWSKEILSDRIIPFPSVHPEDPEAIDRIRQISAAGFRGIKFHPYYQNFTVDDDRLFPVYQQLSDSDLIVVFHTGFDFAFPRDRIAEPARIAALADTFPDLKIVTTHLGAWDDWDEVEKHLAGREIYMEISFSLDFLNKERAQSIISKHPMEYILFGTDSPWTDQGNTLSLFRDLNLGSDAENLILSDNALSLLESD